MDFTYKTIILSFCLSALCCHHVAVMSRSQWPVLMMNLIFLPLHSPDRNNGNLPVVANISRESNFSMELTVTPADYVDVVWYIDNREAAAGCAIDQPLLAGTYEMKVVVTTPKGKSTSREGIISVNPL